MAINILVEVRDLISQVVEQDEGGWVLTENPNDPDGGWTFGGITSITWNEATGDNFVLEDIRAHVKDSLEEAIDTGVEIYFTKYYQPLYKDLSHLPLTMELSAAMNLGVGIVGGWVIPKTGRYKEDFCKAWLDHYVSLVTKNAEAWEHYATATEVDRELSRVKQPATLRAEFLQGWINRVWRYLP